jgi:hypothetical protein
MAKSTATGVQPPAEQRGELRFEALYHPELLHPVNPTGDVGILTLWSPYRTAQRKLDAISPAILDDERSRVAIVANLYGDGLFAMLCNLLYNPQVRHLVAIGEGLGLPTADEIAAFIEHGLEDDVLLGTPVARVRGTGRVLPLVADFDADALRERLSFRCLGRLSSPRLGEELTALLRDLPRRPPDGQGAERRVRVDVPTAVPDDYAYLPSDLGAHHVVRRRPLDCWEELVVRVVRFGRPIELASGQRLELLNAKAVITDPADADLPRREQPATPCLTTLFFRVSGDRLTLTATYRAHNLLTAWLENVYGLMAIQRHVADACGIAAGAITVISHCLGIDPRSPRYDLARTIAASWTRDDDVDRETGKSTLREDPNGYFVVTVDHDRGAIVAEHRFGGVLVKRYEADRAASIEQAVGADMAVTLVSHALWLGRELTRHEQLLRGRTTP